jgi:hypothetical protein
MAANNQTSQFVSLELVDGNLVYQFNTGSGLVRMRTTGTYSVGGIWYKVHVLSLHYTRVKISHLVASLLTSRQQVVFTLLVPSCQQVWNKLLTTCNNIVDIIRLVIRLFQQVRYSHDITVLLQPCMCVVNLVTFLLYRDCIRLVRTTLLQV